MNIRCRWSLILCFFLSFNGQSKAFILSMAALYTGLNIVTSYIIPSAVAIYVTKYYRSNLDISVAQFSARKALKKKYDAIGKKLRSFEDKLSNEHGPQEQYAYGLLLDSQMKWWGKVQSVVKANADANVECCTDFARSLDILGLRLEKLKTRVVIRQQLEMNGRMCFNSLGTTRAGLFRDNNASLYFN